MQLIVGAVEADAEAFKQREQVLVVLRQRALVAVLEPPVDRFSTEVALFIAQLQDHALVFPLLVGFVRAHLPSRNVDVRFVLRPDHRLLEVVTVGGHALVLATELAPHLGCLHGRGRRRKRLGALEEAFQEVGGAAGEGDGVLMLQGRRRVGAHGFYSSHGLVVMGLRPVVELSSKN